MRVLLTGGGGFVGRWLAADLTAAGHEALQLPHGTDVRDAAAVAAAVAGNAPDAIAHLAAVAFAPDAAADPEAAFETAVRGTINVVEAAQIQPQPPALLVTGSSEVYGAPAPSELPLTEASPIRPATPYALSKAAQEAVCLAYAARHGLSAVVTRSFNHTGPGQRGDFVVPALVRRVRDFATGGAENVPVGNVDVRRDISDVRDVARAYRLLVEAAHDGRMGTGGVVVNVCSGRSVSIREVAEALGRLAGATPPLMVDPRLVRKNDPPDIRGDHSALTRLTGWQPQWTLEQTLSDMWSDLVARDG